MTASSRLASRLVAIQFVAWAVTGLIDVAFAPRLLLLDEAVVQGSVRLALGGWGATVAFVVGSTWLVGRRMRPLLRRIASGGVLPADVLALDAVPARLVALDLIGTLLVCATTLLPRIRPESNDLYTQVELVLLAMTLASVAVLPAYVATRASVARALEEVPVAVARAGLELLGSPRRRVVRVRQRLLAAVVAPVAFVALGASLLVHAHLRAFDTSSRQNDAAELAQGVLDAVDGDHRGPAAAIEAARARGFDFRPVLSTAFFTSARTDDGMTTLTVPLSEGHARVRFRTARLSPWTGVYLAFAIFAITMAAAFGYGIGRDFAEDVALATRRLDAAGIADVLRGSPLHGSARFRSVAELLAAADALAGVFREFARAQERAIEARAATERTRALFLASMSHDLKAPLNAVLGFAEIVSREPLTQAQSESLAIIESRGRELLYLIETILDAARAEAGELTITLESTRVGDVIMPAVIQARALAGTHQHAAGAEIVGEIQPGVPTIRADPERLAQALTALVLVALRFAERGHVVVRAAVPADTEQLRIDVEVEGRSSAPGDRERVFEAFKHADRARKHGSLGLGPWLARAIVEAHGGSVAVEQTPAGGTVFHLWLPSEPRGSRS